MNQKDYFSNCFRDTGAQTPEILELAAKRRISVVGTERQLGRERRMILATLWPQCEQKLTLPQLTAW
jgi:hypothetical protein